MGIRSVLDAVALSGLLFGAALGAEPTEPLSKQQRREIESKLERRVGALTREIESKPKDSGLRMARGSAYFHLGKFPESAADFDVVVELDPQRSSSLWQRGITLYYAGRFGDSAKQFEAYHSFDNIDRENGIWRYLAQVAAYGKKKARQGLLKYEKDDREPFPDIYAMFAGKISGNKILKRIRSADISDAERSKRLFYADLYIGLDAAANKDRKTALERLRAAVANPWGQRAGGGPGYMWHVARVHYDSLSAESSDPAAR